MRGLFRARLTVIVTFTADATENTTTTKNFPIESPSHNGRLSRNVPFTLFTFTFKLPRQKLRVEIIGRRGNFLESPSCVARREPYRCRAPPWSINTSSSPPLSQLCTHAHPRDWLGTCTRARTTSTSTSIRARARENKVVDDGRFMLDRGRSMSRCSSRAGESECKSRHPRRRDGARGRARPRA